MEVTAGVAGIICFALALGHVSIGFRWIIPTLTKERFEATPFGRPAATAGMVRFSWHMVSVMLFGFAVLLMIMSIADVEARTVVFRWLAGLWLVASVIAFWQVRRSPRALLRFPVPLFFPVVSILCWVASI